MPIGQWNDNEVVYIGSNHINVELKHNGKTVPSTKNEKIDAIQLLRFLYNQGMGGVDLLRRFASQRRPQLKLGTSPYF